MHAVSGSVNLAVPGKFHILNYAPLLDAEIGLNRLWYAHKPRSARDYGLGSYAQNFPISQYLTQGHVRAFGKRGFSVMEPKYQRFWSRGVMRDWVAAPIFQFLSMGACVALAERARGDGSLVVCEAVNTHPAHRLALLTEEAKRWGVTQPKALSVRDRLQIAEAEQADFLLAPTARVAASYKAHGLAQPSIVIPYAANVQRFWRGEAAHFARGKLNVISVGRVGLRKGQLNLLKALASKDQVNLTLVGPIDRDVRPTLDRFSGRFRHIEFVPHADMPALLSQQHVYVAASLEEGLAVSICEAMAMGLAVIATRESGAEEILIHDKTGLLVDAAAPRQLTDAVTQILDGPQLVERLGTAAREAARSVQNWQSYARILAGHYRSLLKKDRVAA